MASDKPGRYKTDQSGKGSFQPHSDPHQNELHHFAHELATFLEKEFLAHHYAHIVLCAEPHFHGLLNAQLSGKVQSSIKQHIQKDYLPLPKDKLNEIVHEIYKKNVD